MNKAILINAIKQTITETTIDTWRDIAPAINADLFDVVRIDNKNVIYVDDEGLLKSPRHFFIYNGYPQPLAGSGLVLGTTEDGDSADTTLTIEQVKANVRFIQRPF